MPVLDHLPRAVLAFAVAAGFAAEASGPVPVDELKNAERMDLPLSDPNSYAAEMAGFATFRTELRAALESGDAYRVLPLVTLPLTVNLGSDGAIALKDETAFVRHFDQYLTPAWRRAVIAGENSDDAFRSSIPLAHGAAWVRQIPTVPPTFKLWVVNPPDRDRGYAERAVELACETAKGRYRVTREGDEIELQFTPRDRTEEDSVWRNGSDETGGTGDCSARAWSFEHQGRNIAIGEQRCREDEPPEYARASVTDSADGPAELWCY